MTLRIAGGSFRGRILQSPKSRTTRPTLGAVRTAVFNICQTRIEDALFLDLFAGSGAMGLEALSRGAKSALFIDRDQEAISCIVKNIESLGVEDKTLVLKGDALSHLRRLNKKFGIIYIDPPYVTNRNQANALIDQCIETIEDRELLEEDGILFIEEPYTKEKLYTLKKLRVKDKRRIGGSELHQLTYY